MPHKTITQIGAFFACLTLSTCAFADDKASVDRAIQQYYQEIENGYAQKDAARIFAHYDPSHQFGDSKTSNTTDLATNRAKLEQLLKQIKSIRMRVEQEATDLIGDEYFVRYKQVHEILYPLKTSPYSIWYEAEDTWEQSNGQWWLKSTKVVNDAVSQAQAALELQKKRMEFQDEQRRLQRCLTGVGYGCGLP